MTVRRRESERRSGNGHSGGRSAGPRIVVVGASAGGFAAIKALAAELPASFPAAVFVVLHIAPNFPAREFAESLDRASAIHWKLAEDGERFVEGNAYLAPPDAHMLVKERAVYITKGAHENRHRPGIDPLFRSAAVSHGSNVIGVVLTGMLDDGTSGLEAIARCGGITVVQDPADAAFPQMPQSALDLVDVGYRATLAELGALLERLVRTRVAKRKPPPEDVVVEALIAERVVSGCHVGHAFTAATLLETQSQKIEERLWVTLRMLEERRNLARTMAKSARSATSRRAEARAREADVHIKRIREILGAGAPGVTKAKSEARSPKDLPSAAS